MVDPRSLAGGGDMPPLRLPSGKTYGGKSPQIAIRFSPEMFQEINDRARQANNTFAGMVRVLVAAGFHAFDALDHQS